jgi:hypothetical protein
MNRIYRKTLPLITAAGLVLTLAAPALASTFVNPVVDFGSGYAKEGTRLVADHTSTAGDVLLIVGHVVDFNAPFDDLNANDPGVEYTYVYKNLVSAGTVVSGSGLTAVYDTDYSGGVLEVYADPSMNSDFADPATFMDGTMILQATLSAFHTTTLAINCSGNQTCAFQFTGGTLFDRVSAGGIGDQGLAPGLFSVCTGQVPAAQQAQGYFGLSDTKLDLEPSTPTDRRTWGQLKQGLH